MAEAPKLTPEQLRAKERSEREFGQPANGLAPLGAENLGLTADKLFELKWGDGIEPKPGSDQTTSVERSLGAGATDAALEAGPQAEESRGVSGNGSADAA